MCFFNSSFFFCFSSTLRFGFSLFYLLAATAAYPTGHNDHAPAPAPAGVGPALPLAFAPKATARPEPATHHGATDPEETAGAAVTEAAATGSSGAGGDCSGSGGAKPDAHAQVHGHNTTASTTASTQATYSAVARVTTLPLPNVFAFWSVGVG